MNKTLIQNIVDYFLTFIGAFLGIGIIGFINVFFWDFGKFEQIFLIGSFGASAVIIYGIPTSPLAQPKNLFGGHLLSALIGVSIFQLIQNENLIYLSSALSVALSIVAMKLTNTIHPPGGATALIANIGTEKIKSLGFYYIFSPVLTGVLILFLVALMINNISASRRYPHKP